MLQGEPRVAGGKDGAIGGRLFEQLVFVFLRGDIALEQQVRMSVDQSGEHGHLAEVDDAGVGRLPLDLRQRADRPNPFAFDENSYIGLRGGRSAIDQATCFDQDLLGGGRLGVDSGKQDQTGTQER